MSLLLFSFLFQLLSSNSCILFTLHILFFNFNLRAKKFLNNFTLSFPKLMVLPTIFAERIIIFLSLILINGPLKLFGKLNEALTKFSIDS